MPAGHQPNPISERDRQKRTFAPKLAMYKYTVQTII